MILQGENILKQYHHKGGLINALDHVSFTVETGDFVTVTGPSGSGKSSVIAGAIKDISVKKNNTVIYEKICKNI